MPDDRRVKPSRQAKKTRFEDNPVASTVRVPPRRQPGHDTSTRNRRKFKLDVCDPDLLIPINRHRSKKGILPTSESHNHQPVTLKLQVHSLIQRPPLVSLQCLYPVPLLAAQAQRAPVPVALIVQRHHLKAALSHLQMLQAQRLRQHQPVHHGLRHQSS